MIALLDQPEIDDQQHLMQSLVDHCQQWDRELGLDAFELYPELAEEFKKYGY